MFFKVFLPALQAIFAPPPPPLIKEEDKEEMAAGIADALREQEALKAQSAYDENLRIAKELAKNEPRIVASVVKEWLGGS